MYYIVKKRDEKLKTRRKYREHELQASVFYLFRVIHGLGFFIDVTWRKTVKSAFSLSYTLIKHGFLSSQSVRRVLSTYKYI